MKPEIVKQGDKLIFCAVQTIDAPMTSCFELVSTTEGLGKWFAELEMGQLSADGYLLFKMTETEKIEMPILEFEENVALGFAWDNDAVYFRFAPLSENETQLIFTEEIVQVTDHTPRDLAGWTICLDAFKKALEGEEFTFDKAYSDVLYEEYRKKLVEWLN
ncbi:MULTISPECIES: ATPase [unclassified Listeria]|uniref:ATPase n=1 Tax=unclassified Listeria TaxID=2642072 RepID=UPI000B5917FD|nr:MULTISPECIES: ATPase [unclassified Listeria]